ncbi:MAG: portal protein, partial [bacterium]
MVYTNVNSSFPSQVVPDAEKNTLDYGFQVGRAIENEWFRGDRGLGAGGRFGNNWQDFHRLRLYARGEQSVAKYKDELSINGDLSYLNLDWKPVAVLSKFVDIVVNGMTDKGYEIKSFATDPFALKQRTQYIFDAIQDMESKNQIEQLNQLTGQNFYSSVNPEALPKDEKELELYMQLSYKQSVEIAEEELIENVFNYNKYDEIKKRLAYDLVVLGISCVKTDFNLANGITIDYVDPANLVYSYTEDPNFEDVYYVGEVKSVSLEEVKKQFPYLTDAELEEIQKYPGDSNYTRNYWGQDDNYNNVQVLYFEYKTYNNQVFKIKQTDQGLEKALEKPGDFNPPENENFERVHRAIEVLYSGAKILGQEKMLKWQLAENMTRPYSDQTKVQMNYAISAPRIYKGRIESVVSKCIGFADMIQLTHLKIQQVLARMVPDGVFVDVDGLAEVDLGNGTNYNPQEALNMYFQTGSIVGRSKTIEGDLNPGKVPIQELQTSNGQAKIAALVQTYQYYLQMIRDVTGLNEARDGSQPDKNALVGLQKLAAAASNTATKHILQSLMYLT